MQAQIESGMKKLGRFCADNDVSRSQAYREHRAGRLRFTKLGSATLIKSEDEQAWRNALPVYSGEAA